MKVRSKTLQSHCGVELRPSFSSAPQFDLSHLSDHLRNVMIGNFPGAKILRIDTEGAHEGPPRKFTSRQSSNHTVWRGIKTLDVCNMRRQFGLQETSHLLVEVSGIDLRCGSRSLRHRAATRIQQSAENQNNRRCDMEFGFLQGGRKRGSERQQRQACACHGFTELMERSSLLCCSNHNRSSSKKYCP